MSGGLNKYSTFGKVSASKRDGTKETIDLTTLAPKTYVDTLFSSVSSGGSGEERNLPFFPYPVQSIKTTNISNVSNLSAYVSLNEYIVLIGQTTSSQNGLYLQDGVSTATKQVLPTDTNSYFLDVSVADGDNCIYLLSDEFIQTYYKKINLGLSITTTSNSQTDLFDIPVSLNRSSEIILKISGFHTADYSVIFYGEYKRTYYNDNGTYRDFGIFTETTKKSSTFSYPTVTFSTSSSQPNVKITPGNTTSTKWFIKGDITF